MKSQNFVILEDQKAYHQLTMIKVEGKISKKSISILIEIGSTHSYVTLRIVDNYYLVKKRNDKF